MTDTKPTHDGAKRPKQPWVDNDVSPAVTAIREAWAARDRTAVPPKRPNLDLPGLATKARAVRPKREPVDLDGDDQ